MKAKTNKEALTVTFTGIANESQLEDVTSTAERVGCPYEISDYSTKVVVSTQPSFDKESKIAQLNKFVAEYNK